MSHKPQKTITVLGSTGSVGASTLDLVIRNKENYNVVGLTANRNIALLAEQAKIFQAEVVAIADESFYSPLKDLLEGTGVEVLSGADGVIEVAKRQAEWVMAAIVGAAGLKPTLEAVRRGVIVALANKECLVCAGDLMTEEVKKHKATLLPVDSEHNAIYQVFDFEHPKKIEKIILTASGGPFREMSLEEMKDVTPEQAVAHPNWDMGAKISVDSATMMNKGLEMIEAYHLFPIEASQIDVIVHPQSVIHSMVEYRDKSVLAQMGAPDMRIPIAYALAWPDRMETPCNTLNLGEISTLTFEDIDLIRFPALGLAQEALKVGGAYPTILNAANEIAVESFLSGGIGFCDIASLVNETMATSDMKPPHSLANVMDIDQDSRELAKSYLPRFTN